MRTVAEVGSKLFHKMIPQAAEREKFRTILAAHAGKIIQVHAAGVCIPWEALYLAEHVASATHSDFLGWNHVVTRTVSFPYGRAEEVVSVPIKKVGLVEDERLPSVRTRKAQGTIDHLASGIVKVALKPLLTPPDREDFLEFFFDEFEPKQAIQFDCHVHIPHSVHTSHMQVTRRFPLDFDTFKEVEMPDQPFVLFNACSGGSVEWDDTEGYAGSLHAAGAVSIVAAEADLGDGFMTDFAASFYSLNRVSTTVAEALLMARRLKLKVQKNPSALFYSLYGDTRYRLIGGGGPSVLPTLKQLTDLVAPVWPPQPGPEPDYRSNRRKTELGQA